MLKHDRTLIMILLFAFLGFCNAGRWSDDEPFSKSERKRAKLSRDLKKNYNDVDRNGKSLCATRPKKKCCEGSVPSCFGCNPVLLEMGTPCNEQTINPIFFERRDCFCDRFCIKMGDCCQDHQETCPHLYQELEEPTTTAMPTTTTRGTTTLTTVDWGYPQSKCGLRKD